MSELTEKIEELAGGIFGNNHELKPVAEPALVAAIKAGESILTRDHLAEIKLRRGVADLDTLIAACEKFLDLLEAASAEKPAAEPEQPESQPEEPVEPAASPEAPEAPAEEPKPEGA